MVNLFLETLNVSEQQAEQIQGEAGSAGAGEAASKVSFSSKPFGTTGPAATEIESPQIAPDQEETTPKPDAAKIEAVKVEPAKAEAPKMAEAAKIEAAKIEAMKPEPPRIWALNPEVPRFEVPKAEAPKAEAPKFEALKAEAPKIEIARADAPKQTEASKQAEALKTEARKVEAAMLEAAKAEAAKAEAAKAEAAKAEVPKAEAVMAEAAKLGATKVEASGAANGQVEVPKVDTSKAGAVKPEAVKPEVRRFPAKPTIMTPPGDRSWDKKGADAKPESGPVSAAPRERRFTAIAAVLALATVAGALGGALATAGLTHFVGQGTADATGSAADPALEASVARIDADILALKAGFEETSKTGASQFNQTGDRLDKIEQALAEPANNKLAKFSDAVDKLGTAPPAAANAMAAAPREPKEPKEVTGSVTRPVVASAAPASVAQSKPQVGRLPTLDGWVLRDVRRGGALIEGRAGLYEVYAGDPVPGLGRVDAIRKQDGRWVVVTTKGLVVAR
jgi:hypothetical protein